MGRCTTFSWTAEWGPFPPLQFCLPCLPIYFPVVLDSLNLSPNFRSLSMQCCGIAEGPCLCYFFNLGVSFSLLSESLFDFCKQFPVFDGQCGSLFPRVLPPPPHISVRAFTSLSPLWLLSSLRAVIVSYTFGYQCL